MTDTTTPAAPVGLKATKEVVDLVVTAINIGEAALKDGKIGLDDLFLLMQLAPVVGPAFQDIKQVPGELADLDESEATDLVAYVTGKLAIDDVNARAVAEESLKLAVQAFKTYKAIVAAKAAKTAPQA